MGDCRPVRLRAALLACAAAAAFALAHKPKSLKAWRDVNWDAVDQGA